MKSIHEKYLMIPMYQLYYLDDISNYSGLNTTEIESLSDDYSETEIKGIVDALEWGRENPDFNFASILPDLKYSNEQIYEFLTILYKSFLSATDE